MKVGGGGRGKKGGKKKGEWGKRTSGGNKQEGEIMERERVRRDIRGRGGVERRE